MTTLMLQLFTRWGSRVALSPTTRSRLTQQSQPSGLAKRQHRSVLVSSNLITSASVGVRLIDDGYWIPAKRGHHDLWKQFWHHEFLRSGAGKAQPKAWPKTALALLTANGYAGPTLDASANWWGRHDGVRNSGAD